jgi:two-component system response regulator NreC
VNGFVSQQSQGKHADSDGLSDREREVMRFIARGLRTREIAERLSVSHKTVEKHRTNLMRKLGLRTAAVVAAYAISNGYLPS